MRVVLNGWGNVATGLGSELRWLWKLLPFDAWYQDAHPLLGFGEEVTVRTRNVLRRGEHWHDSFTADVVVAVERVTPRQLIPRLAESGSWLVVLANPESYGAVSEWRGHADLVVARTDQAAEHLRGIGILCVRREALVDASEFCYRERTAVQRVVFTNGWGGTHLRKGLPEVREMLRLDPGCLEVYSQRPLDIPHQGPQVNPGAIYDAADLIVMPSRFEGLGLTVLEAMASGCLVAATDAEPMRSFLRAAYGDDADEFLLPVARRDRVNISGQLWPAAYVDPRGALDVIAHARATSAQDLRRLSRAGRSYVERVHGRSALDALRNDIWMERP